MNLANRKAFLICIAISEGTYGIGDEGYNVMVGNTLFHDYSEHPHPKVWIDKIKKYSTAAGRYQLLYKYWLVYRKTLELDKCQGGAFGKDAQDRCALMQIAERHALDEVDSGDFDEAIRLVSNCWASLPGGSQHRKEITLGSLRASFLVHGGTLKEN